MKKIISVPASRRLSFIGLAFLAAILVSSCSKNNNDYDAPPAANLMLFNLAPDKPAVLFTLSGTPLSNAPLGFTSYSGGYYPIIPGSRELRSFDYSNSATIATSTDTYNDSTYYSAFVIGYDGVYRNLVVKDDFSEVTPVAGKAWVRYINAVADTSSRPQVTIGDVTEGSVFGSVSAFRQVNAGNVSATISGGFEATRSLALAENKVYTVLFVGKPGATDPNLAVQVKFIENGNAGN